MAEKAPYNNLVERYERLKRQYFSSAAGRQYDPDTGEEMPNAIDRTFIIQQFENMNVEIPMSPNDPIRFRNQPPR